MMTIEKFTVVSDYDGIELSAVAYIPETPKGIVQIEHGMCEHKGRYDAFMRFFAEHGYIVVAHDHRGHGESVKSNDDFGFFGDPTGEGIVEDAAQITREIKARFGDLPVTLFGHSMGSLVVRCYIQKYDDRIEKLIVCGSPSKNPLAGVAIALTKMIAKCKGERHRSKTLFKLSTGGNDKNFKGEGVCAWLTRDRKVVEEYLASEGCGYIFTANGYLNLFSLLKHTYEGDRYALKNKTLPIFFVAGSDDPVIVSEEKWAKAQAFLREIGYENVSGKLYHQFRHEILNEIGKEEVYANLLSFVEAE
jgi:alpha-beta hydrolase superfamily lysophospholipase